ncbi:DUF6797 domain-containing protein [Rubripirellula tenax]|nr:DUF6797 domain-containing protein [Rubripirellula tenax]
MFLVMASAWGETPALHQLLERADPANIAAEARLRGNPNRGALVYFKSAAGCVQCHQGTAGQNSPLGPDLSRLGEGITDVHLVEALLHPSKSIRKGFGTVQILTFDGDIKSGMFVREDDETLVLRDAGNLQAEIVIAKHDIEVRSEKTVSMMPGGLMATLGSQRDILDLFSYLFAIQAGGPDRAHELKPNEDQLIVVDDAANLNHAGILRRVEKSNAKGGKQIFEASCVQCHGADGNTPSLATARAFGKQKLKFGADPYSMFKTLSNGNGLMAATTALSPIERYEVIGYIRNRFMKDSNPEYKPITDDYLKSLPTGTDMGDFKPDPDRDYGPALASQLGRDVNSALTVSLGDQTIAYNLHTMDQAGLWAGGFLDVDQTQHKRGRGEGYAQPKGNPVPALATWQWGHDASLDYPTDDLLPRGPLPNRWLDYHGHHLHGDQIVLSYAIDGREILEVPSAIDGETAVRQTLRISPGKSLVLAIGPQQPQITGDTTGVTSTLDEQQRWVVRIPRDKDARVIDIVRFADAESDSSTRRDLNLERVDPAKMIEGGDLRWPQTLETVGYRGFQDSAYAVDTISIPESSPWNTWFRTSAIDFFPDGRLAVATVGGDVWIVSGVDDELMNLRWKRFAGGMYEPFGIKVVDGLIYVTCRDRLTRLHDLNNDGEADFYENFSADTDVSTYFHAFNFDLQTDSQGNFYYAKAGQYTDYKLAGAIVKVSPDGKTRSIVCTGLRTPNGMGILPDDRLTVSDNQGTWMPASKVNLVKPGGFYGYVQNKKGGAWAPDGGRIDVKKVVPPKTFDQPLIWMPQEVDNSSGGQVFVDDSRWGPLAGRLLHTSFGQGSLFYLMKQEIGGVEQASLVKFPHDFDTGIMRGRVNPVDGQLYVTGLNGWNDNGRAGLADKGIYRVRYTGKPLRMIENCQVESGGLRIQFNFPVDSSSATDVASYVAQQWNYKWTENYGSDHYHPETREPGEQSVVISNVELSDDRKSVLLKIPRLRPVNQLRLQVNVKDESGATFSEDIYWTIHSVAAPNARR